MVQGRVDVVGANGVHTQVLHERRIAQTGSAVAERVLRVRRAVCALSARLVVDTNDHEAVIRLRVNKLLLLHNDRVYGDDGARERAQCGEGRKLRMISALQRRTECDAPILHTDFILVAALVMILSGRPTSMRLALDYTILALLR